ncbi:MAG: hypothetical protein EH225_00145 [Calditrichaeota bacterium]|nr:MAG: hypothetical protein EH225_00145 [Calditrichota bacterium]
MSNPEKTDKEKSEEKPPQFSVKTEDIQKADYWEYCDNCGARLIARKCELICPRCGFFRSCSEP